MLWGKRLFFRFPPTTVNPKLIEKYMPDGICLKGQIRGHHPKKWCFFGGGDPPIDFQNYLADDYEIFFGTTSTYLESGKKISDPIEYSTPVEYSTKSNFFGKNRHFWAVLSNHFGLNEYFPKYSSDCNTKKFGSTSMYSESGKNFWVP